MKSILSSQRLSAIFQNKLERSSWYKLLFFSIFILFILFRFYGLEERSVFSWDQVDNAWAAKNILIDHKIQLVGMVAKQNTGFFIGPIYYYFVALFYFFSHMDPIALIFIAGVASIVSFITLYVVTKKLFSREVALFAAFLYTISVFAIQYDRIQWPINFVPPISLLIYFALCRILQGYAKYILYLSLLLGLSLHLNFTSIFFFIITIFALPFFPKTKETIKYIFLGLPLFVIFLIPNIIYEMTTRHTASDKMISYLQTYYHGFHITRMIQLGQDAFIEFEEIMHLRFLRLIKFAFIPFFILMYLRDRQSKKEFFLVYLLILWFLIPWLVFTVYSGEISNYYFALTRPLVFMVISYITVWLWNRRKFVVRLILISFWAFFAFVNIVDFMKPIGQPLAYHKKVILRKIQKGEKVDFVEGWPEPFLYYYYTEIKK